MIYSDEIGDQLLVTEQCKMRSACVENWSTEKVIEECRMKVKSAD